VEEPQGKHCHVHVEVLCGREDEAGEGGF